MHDAAYIQMSVHGARGVVAQTLVDADLYDDLSRTRWCLDRKGYVRGVRGQLHRVVLGLRVGDEMQGDHINLDKLDNRRSNLRRVTHAEQQQNRPSQRGSTSVHRGVSWHKRDQRWQAVVVLGGKYHFLGCFDDEMEAARVASAFRAEHMPFSQGDVGRSVLQ